MTATSRPQFPEIVKCGDCGVQNPQAVLYLYQKKGLWALFWDSTIIPFPGYLLSVSNHKSFWLILVPPSAQQSNQLSQCNVFNMQFHWSWCHLLLSNIISFYNLTFLICSTYTIYSAQAKEPQSFAEVFYQTVFPFLDAELQTPSNSCST